MRALELGFFLPGDLLVKMDRATMAASLEARSPLLDHEVIELAATFPPALLLRGGRTKAVLRELARDLLPAEVRRAPKRGFEVPLVRWLVRPLGRGGPRGAGGSSAAVGAVAPVERRRAWRDWSERPDRERAARAVYTLLTLEHWLRRWV